MKPVISIVTVNWRARDFLDLQIKSLLKNASGENWFEYIVVDNSGELVGGEFGPLVKVIKTNSRIGHGHGAGLDLGVMEAQGEYVFILDIDSHVLLKDWDKHLLSLFQQDKKLACVTDGELLKPAKPLAMFFRKKTIVENNISFKAREFDGVKFDVGVHAYFKILSLYGDNAILGLPWCQTKYDDVLGCEYLLDGNRFVYHNWYGTRWYFEDGSIERDEIDGLKYEEFLRKKINLFKQFYEDYFKG